MEHSKVKATRNAKAPQKRTKTQPVPESKKQRPTVPKEVAAANSKAKKDQSPREGRRVKGQAAVASPATATETPKSAQPDRNPLQSFSDCLEAAKSRLEGLASNWEAAMKGTSLPPSVIEEALVIVGQTRLLTTSKFKQFAGLIERAQKQRRQGGGGDGPKIEEEDLAGFWDMVNIEVNHLYSKFDNLALVRDGVNVPLAASTPVAPSVAKGKTVQTARRPTKKPALPHQEEISNDKTGGGGGREKLAQAAAAQFLRRSSRLAEKRMKSVNELHPIPEVSVMKRMTPAVGSRQAVKATTTRDNKQPKGPPAKQVKSMNQTVAKVDVGKKTPSTAVKQRQPAKSALKENVTTSNKGKKDKEVKEASTVVKGGAKKKTTPKTTKSDSKENDTTVHTGQLTRTEINRLKAEKTRRSSFGTVSLMTSRMAKVGTSPHA